MQDEKQKQATKEELEELELQKRLGELQDIKFQLSDLDYGKEIEEVLCRNLQPWLFKNGHIGVELKSAYYQFGKVHLEFHMVVGIPVKE